MKPILYKSTETEFKSNGIGVLSDAISCIVTEKRNGVFDLQMKYPVDGIHYSDIEDRSIILAKPNPTDDAQPFRVYRSTKPLNGIVTFFANHISYDLLGIPVSPFTADNISGAMAKLKTNAVGDCPFTFHTDKETVAKMNVRVPTDIRSLLAGQSGSILDVYGGGEYKFDRFDVYLTQHRGIDRGVSIRYGKNLLDLEQERNISNVYTGVYPYWTDMNGENLVQLPEKVVNAPGTYDYTKIKPLDFSSDYENAPTVEQIRAKAESYIKNNNIGVPSVNLTVSHAMLENTEEYKGQALLERIDLCDTATIEFPKLGVSANAKAIQTEFNVLLDRYESITFGDATSSFIQTAVEQRESEKRYTSLARNLVGQAMDKLNEIVQNSSGLYTTEEVHPDGSTIYYFHDKPELTDSKNVIRFTAEAIGLSTDGGKSYPFGFTVTGDMVARILSAIGVNADWINVGVLQSAPDENGERNFVFDLETGEAVVKNLSIHGQTADEIAGEKADEALKDAQGYADAAAAGALNDFVSSTYGPKILDLQKQIDGQIESFFFDHEPTLGNEPASAWETETDKAKHEGDLFYWKSKGYAYRFFKDGDTWKWQMVQDTDITSALEKASQAQFTADGKSRTFVSEPVTPYDVGDQWYRGDKASTLVCTKARHSGAFDMGDWEKLDDYINKAEADASAAAALKAFAEGEFAETVKELQGQVDQKADSWYQESDPSTAWTTTEDKANHKGDMWRVPGQATAKQWDGEKWVDMTVNPPQAVFDALDGKAQIWASKPKPPYHENDLWFGGTDAPVKICITTREDGDFVDADWIKYDYYISLQNAKDEAKNAVDAQSQEDIFNKLTHNGEDQGIYLKDGKVYINLEYLKSNIINLNILKLAGTLCGLMQGYGMTASGITTEGIVMYGNGLDASGNANPPYLIVTDSGIRGQTSKDYEFNMAGGAFEVEGNITTRAAGNMIGNVTAAGNVSASGNVRGKVFSMMPNGEMLAQIMEENGYLQIGGSTGTYIGGRPIYIGVAGTEQILGTPVYIRGDVDFSEANVSGLNFEDLYIAGLRALNYSSETGNMAVGPASGANVVIQGDRSYLGTVGTQRAQVTGETIQVGYIAGETGKTENLTINGVNVTVNSTSTKINGDTIAVGKYGSNLANCYWRTVTMADGVTRTILTKEPYNAT